MTSRYVPNMQQVNEKLIKTNMAARITIVITVFPMAHAPKVVHSSTCLVSANFVCGIASR